MCRRWGLKTLRLYQSPVLGKNVCQLSVGKVMKIKRYLIHVVCWRKWHLIHTVCRRKWHQRHPVCRSKWYLFYVDDGDFLVMWYVEESAPKSIKWHPSQLVCEINKVTSKSIGIWNGDKTIKLNSINKKNSPGIIQTAGIIVISIDLSTKFEIHGLWVMGYSVRVGL